MSSNTLFNQPLMKKYLKKYKKEFKLTHKRKESLLNWIKKLENGELKDEVSNYGSFSRTILENILGYNYDKNIEENVKEEYGRGFSEFALKKDNKKFMVIELKGSDSNLDKPQNRANDKRTPVDQAFDYAKRSGDIDWIMVSNYNEFRLYNYHKRTHKYISFQVKELLDPDIFAEFMLVFSRFSTIDENLIEKLVSKTIFVERDLESEFYKLYNETRLMIIKELESIHSEFSREQSVHYAQLILNRYIFICFAEDLGLLPGEISVESIENPVKNNNLGRTEIWHRLNSLFIDINEGNEFKKIYAYNGGLFSEDLEFLKIRDIVEDHSIFSDAYQKWKFEEYSLLVEEKLSPYSGQINPIYKNLMTISTFNFSSEVDVNILGHIFENSIGDIEELKADTKGRRKKDGIFYTPEHITEYICQNTIIPYLSKSGNANTIQKLISEYSGSEIEELDGKVKKIKIVDPACGSGAFLNKAGDVLLEIHKAIRKYKYKDDYTLMPFFDSIEERRKILLNNIYGVDLNEESVEITKLSLFLKVCKKGLKLPNLDNNIKCGNSLINDIKFTENPFNWQSKEGFNQILNNNGFDIVIGNPPYINISKIPKNQLKYLKEHYISASYGRFDLYLLFMEKAINLLANGGFTSFIIPDKFCTHKYASTLRKTILDNCEINLLVNLNGFKIFKDAVVDNIIYTFKKSDLDPKNGIIQILNPSKEYMDNEMIIGESNQVKQAWFNEIPEYMFRLGLNYDRWELIKKIKGISGNLENICYISFGLQPGNLNKFVFNKITNPERITENPHAIKKFIRGRNIKRYYINYTEDLVFYLPKELHRPAFPELFENEKITISEISKDIKATFDNQAYYGNETTVQVIPWTTLSNVDNNILKNRGIKLKEELLVNSEKYKLKYVLGVLNSNLINFFFKIMISEGLHVFPDNIRKLPIANVKIEQQYEIIEKVDQMLKLNKNFQDEINSFKEWLTHIFKVDKFSKKLEKYYELSFDEFLAELKKKKVDVKNRDNFTTLKEEFEKSVSKIRPLLQEIEETDNEIDQMVYELYGLTDDEIKIVEDSLN